MTSPSLTVRSACLLAALATAFPATAGSAAGAVGVRITLATQGSGGGGAASGIGVPGVCISQTLSEQNGAIVRVACESGQFVSISPVPGGRFIDTHGGAYTYHFGSLGAANHSGDGDFAYGSGTIASFRVYSVQETDGPLDMLVSF